MYRRWQGSCNNQYEMSLNSQTQIRPCMDAADIKKIQYHFFKISDIQNLEENKIIGTVRALLHPPFTPGCGLTDCDCAQM